jgi:menaquinone-dependent protoporphyrinogen oxidase
MNKDFPNWETNMPEKILVAYASRAGSTAEVAQAIGKSLAEGGPEVDVLPMQDVKDLSPYRAVVAGSAIRGKKWLPEAMQFIKANQTTLAGKPFAAFLVCITLAMKDGEKYRPFVAEWLQPVRSVVKPVSEGLFAGRLDFSKLPFDFKTLQMRLSVALGIFPKDDKRDWDAIQKWAESLKPLLQ